MHNEELVAVFDQQASCNEQQWGKMGPIRNGLFFLLESVFTDLPADARVLSVGAGTGAEIAHLAHRFPKWSFTAIEPSRPMLDICRQRAENEGFATRCQFHQGYLDSLPAGDPHQAATCFLVSQFIPDRQARSAFFQGIANRLGPGGILASSDLASGAGSQCCEAMLRLWMNVMSGEKGSPERLEQMRNAWSKDVAVLPPDTVASIIESGGFGSPVLFYQAGPLHAWFAERETDNVA